MEARWANGPLKGEVAVLDAHGGEYSFRLMVVRTDLPDPMGDGALPGAKYYCAEDHNVVPILDTETFDLVLDWPWED